MSTSLEHGPVNVCLECDRAPIPLDKTFCSIECATAYEFSPKPQGFYDDLVVSDNDSNDGLGQLGPVMYGEVETEQQSDPRECNGCGERVSAGYARTFAWENGTLFCADCKSRSERYSMDPSYGPDHDSDPSQLTGSSNPRSDANKALKRPEGTQ